jgi:hypothetical protein
VQNSTLDLFRSEQSRRKLRRIVRDFARFFQEPDSAKLLRKGLTMLPDGNVVPDDIRSLHDAEDFFSADEIEPQEPFGAGEWAEMDHDCRELLRAIDEGRWDDCYTQMSLLYGRTANITITEPVNRKDYDELYEEFEEALEYLQSVEFAPLWVPSTPELLTAEEFTFVDRKIAEQIVKDPRLLFSVDPRFFEELIASIYEDLGYRTILTKRTQDGGRDIIGLARKDYMDQKLIIECKRYAPHRKVSVSQVRSLYGVSQAERVTKALLATTSSFTKSAREFATPHIWQLGLLEFKDIVRMIQNYAAR